MRARALTDILRRVQPLLVASLFLIVALGCGGDRYIVVGSARAPSVSGWVTIEDASESSALVTVHLEQLHPVKNLDPALRSYVLWFEPKDGGSSKAVRGGSLRYKADDRVGEVQARSPFGKFVVKVTAEANDTPGTPSDFVVASEEITLED
jgi:hypothetical protein